MTYTVQVQPQILDPTGETWQFAHRPAGPYLAFGLQQPPYVMDFAEGWLGRWRVWAVDGNGRRSLKSSWQYFFFPIAADPVQPELTFTVNPNQARRGGDVSLYLSIPVPVTVYLNRRVLPKRVLAGGSVLVVTVPGDAILGPGVFELLFQGQYFGTPDEFTILP